MKYLIPYAALALLSAVRMWGAPPPNDNFTNATVLTGNSLTFTGSLAQATLEPDEMQWFAYPLGPHSIWWRWTAIDSAPVTIYVARSSAVIDFVNDGLAVWQHDGPFTGFFDFRPFFQPPALALATAKVNADLTFVPIPGKNYYFQAVGWNEATVELVLIATNRPVIVTQPQSLTANSGASVPFAVTASGIRPFGYQWQFNGAILPGGNGAIIGLTNLTAADAGDYTVVITNATGSVTSQVAHLTVSDAEVRPLLRVGEGSTPNRLLVSIQAEAGRYYRIESSTNLLDWSEEKQFTMIPAQLSAPWLTSVLFASNSLTSFSITNNWKQKFVRAKRYLPANEVCNLSLKKIRIAKELFLRDNHGDLTYHDRVGNDAWLLPYLGNTWIHCPLGGYYDTGEFASLPVCSVPGHVLEEPR